MNDVVFFCPHCGQQVSCDAEGAGQQVPCPTCQKLITVPVASQPPPPPPPKTIAPPPAPGVARSVPPPPPPPAVVARTAGPPPPPGKPATATPKPPGSGAPAPAPAVPAKKSNGLAVAALVLAFFAPLGSIPAIICGHKARGRIKRDPAYGGKGLATAGLVMGYGFLSVWVIGTVLLLTVFASFLSQFKKGVEDAMNEAATKTNLVASAGPGDQSTNAVSAKSVKSGKSKTTPAIAEPEPVPAKDEDQVAAVEKVVKRFLAAEKSNDREAMRSLLTTKAKKNINMINAAPETEEEILFRIEKTEVEGNTAKSLLRVKTGTEIMSSYCRLKQEEGEWRVYAMTLLMDRDEPALTIDLEKGLPPIIETDQAKLAAFMVKLNASSKKAPAKTSKTTRPPVTRPPPVQPVEPTPPPPPPEPVVALDFGSHKRPADLEFVELTATRAVKVRVTNYANKSIRKLNVAMYFLDAAASPLGQKIGFLLNPDPHIVAKGDTAEVVFSGITAPAEAKKAVIELREVQFKDGTSWKAPGQ